jgi:chromosome segregation ATPase
MGMGRFFAALRRYFNFFFLRRSEDVRNAADQQFTGSVEGIQAAYAVDRDRLSKDFRALQEAVAQVLTIAEDKKIQLERLAGEEQRLQTQLNGAINAAEHAQASGDTEEYGKAKAAYVRYQARMTEIDGDQERMTTEVADLEASMKTHMARLTALQAELDRLPREEAETIAEYVSAKQVIELNNRLMNAYDSLQEGPSSVVRAEVRKMSAQARITEQLAGTDVKLQDQQYEQLGREMEGEDSLEAVLAARRAEREGTAATPAPAEREPGASEAAPPAEPPAGASPPERPQI